MPNLNDPVFNNVGFTVNSATDATIDLDGTTTRNSYVWDWSAVADGTPVSFDVTPTASLRFIVRSSPGSSTLSGTTTTYYDQTISTTTNVSFNYSSDTYFGFLTLVSGEGFEITNWVASTIDPPPAVPVGYTRYPVNSSTADTGEGSFFQGLTITDGSYVDAPDAMLEVGPPAGYVVLDGSDATGQVIRPVAGSYTLYIYDGDTGDYDPITVNYSVAGGGFIRCSLSLGIGLDIG